MHIEFEDVDFHAKARSHMCNENMYNGYRWKVCFAQSSIHILAVPNASAMRIICRS